MKISSAMIILVILALSSLQYGMARQGQYDEEAREQERLEKAQRKAARSSGEKVSPAKNFVGGLGEATVGSTATIVGETAEGAKEGGPIAGTLEGANKAAGDAFDKTLKGAVKVATLGYGNLNSYEIEDPKANQGQDTSKVKIKF